MSGESNVFSPAVRRLVLARAAGACERCGRVGRVELHHRQFRSRGGGGGVENAVALCGFGNASGCHGWVHRDGLGAELAGYALSAGSDPCDVPLFLFRFNAVVRVSGGFVFTAFDVPCVTHLRVESGCRVCVPAGELLWQLPSGGSVL